MSFADHPDDRDAGGGMGIDPRYWFWVFRRRFWLFAAVAAATATAGLGTAMVLPPVYEARASLLVESQQIPSDLVRSTISASASEQIEVIKQRLLTRETLLEIAQTHDVFADAGALTPTERADRMRAAVRLDQRVLGGGRRGRSDTVSTAVSISFRGDSGPRAAAVVNDLAARVLSQSAELRRSRAETTSDYFRQEVARLGDELGRAEARIVTFQNENAEALPESLGYRRSQLDLLQERLQRFELEELELRQEQESLESALGGNRAAPLGEIALELVELRRMLTRRSIILTEDHPEIRTLTRRIEAQERAAAAERAVAGDAVETRDQIEAADPAVRELRRRLALVDARRGFNAEVVTSLIVTRDALERSLQETPNIQMELGALLRSHESLELRYRVALGKLAEAEAGEQLEDKQQGERFELIERASVPEGPVAPNRKAWAALGVGGGVGAGLGLIVLLEMMSNVVRRPEDLARIGREPAAVIPWISTAAERRWMWFRRILSVAVVAGGGAAALWALHIHYLPLETIWAKLLDASGLVGALEMVGRRFGG
jgi:polysaccharide biosynthesis transport protein